MKTAWLNLLAAGLVGAVTASACVIKSDDDDDGEGGRTSTGGRASGGTSTGGKATGGSGTGGATSGGQSSTGGASTGGSKATGGTTSTGGSSTAVFCDPDSGNPLSTPASSCEFAAEDLTGPLGPCLTCLSKASSCCKELKDCYGDDPNNQCGWGGPNPGETEYLCYQDCLVTRAEAGGGAYDPDSDPDECAGLCVTPACGTIGNYTNDLIVCMHDNCEDECFVDPAM
jgi:hypothetical protein